VSTARPLKVAIPELSVVSVRVPEENEKPAAVGPKVTDWPATGWFNWSVTMTDVPKVEPASTLDGGSPPVKDTVSGPADEEATVIVKGLVVAVCDGADESVAETVKWKSPLDVGVPAIAPVEGSMLRPGGSDPETDQVTAPTVAPTVGWALYAVPVTPEGRGAVMIGPTWRIKLSRVSEIRSTPGE
jgi:hypothetical protein